MHPDTPAADMLLGAMRFAKQIDFMLYCSFWEHIWRWENAENKYMKSR